MKDNSLPTSQYIGPINNGVGYEQIADYDPSFSDRTCNKFILEAKFIKTGVNQLCILNSCIMVNIWHYFPWYDNFKGEISFDKFVLYTVVEVDTINPFGTV